LKVNVTPLTARERERITYLALFELDRTFESFELLLDLKDDASDILGMVFRSKHLHHRKKEINTAKTAGEGTNGFLGDRSGVAPIAGPACTQTTELQSTLNVYCIQRLKLL
jgi:hypothetical protein